MMIAARRAAVAFTSAPPVTSSIPDEHRDRAGHGDADLGDRGHGASRHAGGDEDRRKACPGGRLFQTRDNVAEEGFHDGLLCVGFARIGPLPRKREREIRYAGSSAERWTEHVTAISYSR